MKHRVLAGLAATVLAAIVLAPDVVVAQTPTAAKGELALTYSVMRLEGTSAPAGIGIDVSRAIARSANNIQILLVGDASINRFGASTEYQAATQTQAMGGIRFAGGMSGGASPFAHVMAGVVSCCDERSTAVMVGVGISAPIANRRTRIRVQADFPTVFYKAGAVDGVAYDAYRKTGVRFNAGLALPFGH